MKILIDAVGVPRGSGGVELWAEQLIVGWSKQFPGDQVFVIGHRGLVELARKRGMAGHVVEAKGPLQRAVAQLLVVPWIYWVGTFERLLSLNPIVSPLLIRENVSLMNHDWRHIRRPGEFGRIQRAYRFFWKVCSSRVPKIIAVSEKTAQETRLFSGRAGPIAVVNPGADHLDGHGDPVLADLKVREGEFLLAFGRYPNKRPHLAIEALALLSQQPRYNLFKLVLLGTPQDTQTPLRNLAKQRNVGEAVVFHSFVSPPEYAWLLKSCAALLVFSTDEGYSVPVMEAHYFGKPVLVSEGSGIKESIHPGIVAAPDDVGLIVDSLGALLENPSPIGAPTPVARRWSEVISEVRKIVCSPSG